MYEAASSFHRSIFRAENKVCGGKLTRAAELYRLTEAKAAEKFTTSIGALRMPIVYRQLSAKEKLASRCSRLRQSRLYAFVYHITSPSSQHTDSSARNIVAYHRSEWWICRVRTAHAHLRRRARQEKQPNSIPTVCSIVSCIVQIDLERRSSALATDSRLFFDKRYLILSSHFRFAFYFALFCSCESRTSIRHNNREK